jgi:hypothetical protein
MSDAIWQICLFLLLNLVLAVPYGGLKLFPVKSLLHSVVAAEILP